MKGAFGMNILELSRYIIKQYHLKDKTITNLKLQKILYYIQGYFFKKRGKEAFKEEIYCWPYGPVVKEAYFEYNGYGARDISVSECDFKTDLNEISKLDKKCIDEVISKTFEKSAFELVNQTHLEAPWRDAHDGKIIPKDTIEMFFNFEDPLKIRNN